MFEHRIIGRDPHFNDVDIKKLSFIFLTLFENVLLVYGAMSKIGLLRIFLLQFNFVGYFASSNPSLPESSCCHFFPLHVWLPFRIQNGRFIQGSKNQLTLIKLKSMLVLILIHFLGQSPICSSNSVISGFFDKFTISDMKSAENRSTEALMNPLP